MILDVEMPVMDGLTTLKNISQKRLPIEVIMFSSHTKAGAVITLQALELGAFDFVPKPEADSLNRGIDAVRKDMLPRLTFLHTRKTLRDVSGDRGHRRAAAVRPVVRPAPETPPKISSVTERMAALRPAMRMKRKAVALGISTGGPRALASMMVDLPAELDAGMLIVQHMPPVFTQTLAQRLNELCPLEVREAKEGDAIMPGLVLLAPGGRHMTVVREGKDGVRVGLNDDPPENSCRPSVDVLFRSVAEIYGPDAVGVIMTGMGHDGTEGLRLMKNRGAYVIAQNEATCTVFGMPKKPVEEGLAEEILPLEEIGGAIARAVSGKGKQV
jgi:two-component system chemotaxis response regulator CheB